MFVLLWQKPMLKLSIFAAVVFFETEKYKIIWKEIVNYERALETACKK